MTIKTKKAARRLIGRTIKRVALNPFLTCNAGNPRERTTDPVLVLDDGSALAFSVTETETGEYGVEILHVERSAAR